MTKQNATLSFVHRFEAGTARVAPLLLLHGTGGNENDLIPLGRKIEPGAPLLSPRGQVLEHGMPRFFRRLEEGVFDEDDLRQRVDDLASFVAEARQAYDLEAPIAVGFSNGANISAAMLLTRPGVLSGAILLRAMAPFRQLPRVALQGTPVLMVSGHADSIVPEADASRLVQALAAAGSSVEHRIVPGGHGLSATDVSLAQAWLAERRAKAFA